MAGTSWTGGPQTASQLGPKLKEIQRPLAREPIERDGPLDAKRLSDPLLEVFLLACHVVAQEPM